MIRKVHTFAWRLNIQRDTLANCGRILIHAANPSIRTTKELSTKIVDSSLQSAFINFPTNVSSSPGLPGLG